MTLASPRRPGNDSFNSTYQCYTLDDIYDCRYTVQWAKLRAGMPRKADRSLHAWERHKQRDRDQKLLLRSLGYPGGCKDPVAYLRLLATKRRYAKAHLERHRSECAKWRQKVRSLVGTCSGHAVSIYNAIKFEAKSIAKKQRAASAAAKLQQPKHDPPIRLRSAKTGRYISMP